MTCMRSNFPVNFLKRASPNALAARRWFHIVPQGIKPLPNYDLSLLLCDGLLVLFGDTLTKGLELYTLDVSHLRFEDQITVLSVGQGISRTSESHHTSHRHLATKASKEGPSPSKESSGPLPELSTSSEGTLDNAENLSNRRRTRAGTLNHFFRSLSSYIRIGPRS